MRDKLLQINHRLHLLQHPKGAMREIRIRDPRQASPLAAKKRLDHHIAPQLLKRHLRLVRRLPGAEDRAWAAAVIAVNAGTMALVFSFVPFTTQVGLQFWFLEGALHGAVRDSLETRA